jgi:thymidylate kinase
MEYDSLIDDNPDIQERIRKAEKRGRIQILHEVALNAVKDEYPDLAEFAEERIVRIQKRARLRLLVKLIYKAPDEKTVRWLLETVS